MAKPRILVAAALLLVAVCVAVAVATAKREPPLTARVVEVTNIPGGFSVTLQMSNATEHAYIPQGIQLQITNGAAWKERPHTFVFLERDKIDGHSLKTFSVDLFSETNRFEPGERFRLAVRAGMLRRGLNGFPFRLKCWIFNDQRHLSLNPFDRSPVSYPDTSFTTDAFTAP
ncbi:MAG TPA: hypothetical protein VFE51_11160 [Verrucomicrobiae bacterium]|nr:hypothetical protein [Verrucomicrobiae bacterium]